MPNNPEQFDVVIIGAGSGGLVMAAVAANLNYKVALVEKGKMGGDCLNYGCVPSKALIAAAKTAHHARNSGTFGIHTGDVQVNFEDVHQHVHEVIATIAPNDSVARFKGMGVNVIKAHGTFVDAKTLQAGGRTLTARRFVIATGSGAMIPPIEGLDDVPYLTNETLFDLKEAPKHLLIMGGGPIGAEMAQAFKRLGSDVTVIEMAERILAKDDPQLAQVVIDQFAQEGITLKTGMKVVKAKTAKQGVTLTLEDASGKQQITEGSHLLVAAGRSPNVDGMGLDKAGVDYTPKGIQVNKSLRTTNKRIYAVGDCVGPYQFTHMAGYQAGIVITSSLFGVFTTKVTYNAVPWATYTDPELANVGLTEAQAREKWGDKTGVTTFNFAENDRAQTERDTRGMVKVITNPKGVVVGAAIVGAQAGDLIHEWAYMITHKQKIKNMTGVIHAYPTRAEANKRVAGEYFKDAFYSTRTSKISKLLFRLFG